MLTLGVIGSGKGSNFGAILAAMDAGELPGVRVGVVVSDVADAGILQLARARGLPAHHLPPGRFKTKLEPGAEGAMVALLRAHGVNLVVLAGFMRLVKAPLLAAFPGRILNVHPSLLPAFPGLRAWEQALAAGVGETGCSVHLVDAGMDTGEILGQARIPVEPGDTPETLHARIQAAEHRLYPEVIARYARNDV